jgi:hypothetical protein
MIRRILLASLVAAPSALMAQAVAHGHASATIVAPIAIAEAVPMTFGALVTAGGGVATLDSNNLMTPGAGLVFGGGLPRAGVFTVTGEPNQHYQVEINPAPFALTRQGGAETMNATVTGIRFQTDEDAMEYNLVGAGGILPWNTLPAGGQETIHIAATLAVANNQAAGVYEGIYDVTVRYQ